MGLRIHKVLGYGIRGVMKPHKWGDGEDREIAHLLNGTIHNLKLGRKFKPHEHLPATTDIPQMESNSIAGRLRLEIPVFGDSTPRMSKYPNTFRDVVHFADYPDNMDKSDQSWWVFVPPSCFHLWYRFDDTMDYYDAVPELGTTVKQLREPLYPYIRWMDKETGQPLPDPRVSENIQTVPFVPEVIQLIATHLEFPDWRQLRPVLIRWWA